MGTVAIFQLVPGDGAGFHCLGEKMNPGERCQTNGASSICSRFHEADERYYENGVLKRIRVHRRGRLAPSAFGQGRRPFKTPWYRIDFDAVLGQPVQRVLAGLPEPRKIASVVDPDFGPVVRYTFSGLEIEAEKGDGHDIVGAVVIVEK